MSSGPVGILGGTFDPIHYGHLRLAQEAAQALKLGGVRFIPSATPPHRAAPPVSAAERLEMMNLAVRGNPLFSVDAREFARAGPGYMVDTLLELRQELGRTVPMCLLLGADAFLDLATWSRWHQLFKLAHVVVAHTVASLVDSLSDNPAAKLTAQEIAERVKQAQAGG